MIVSTFGFQQELQSLLKHIRRVIVAPKHEGGADCDPFCMELANSGKVILSQIDSFPSGTQTSLRKSLESNKKSPTSTAGCQVKQFLILRDSESTLTTGWSELISLITFVYVSKKAR